MEQFKLSLSSRSARKDLVYRPKWRFASLLASRVKDAECQLATRAQIECGQDWRSQRAERMRCKGR